METKHLNHNTILICRYHPDAVLIEDYRAGDMICSQCGLIVGDRLIDVGCEWRTFTDEKSDSTDMTRVGAAQDPTIDVDDLSTRISKKTSNSNGNCLYKASESAKNKAKRKVNNEIKEMGERLSADQSIINSANHIYYNVQKNKIIKGRSNNAVLAACVFIACRDQNCPRTFKEISGVSQNGNVSVKDIGRCYKIIRNALQSSITNNANNSLAFNNSSASASSDLIFRFCSKLDYCKEVRQLANYINLKTSEIPTLTSRSPNSLAASSIYLSASLLGSNLRTAEEIGKICGAAGNTIRLTTKLMYAHLGKLIPQGFASKSLSYKA